MDGRIGRDGLGNGGGEGARSAGEQTLWRPIRRVPADHPSIINLTPFLLDPFSAPKAAGFQVIIGGRFWVIADSRASRSSREARSQFSGRSPKTLCPP